MNMSLYWGPGSPNLNGSHGHWTILKADGSPTSCWNPPSGVFTGSGGATIASSTWTGTPLEREFKVRVWCDNVVYNGVYDVGEAVSELERLVTVFKVQIKSPPDGFDPPRQYVAAGGSVGYYAYIIPSSAAGLGFAWTGNNVPAKFTLAGAASQTVTVTAGSQPSSAINAEQVTVTVKAPVTNAVLTQASQNFTIFTLEIKDPPSGDNPAKEILSVDKGQGFFAKTTPANTGLTFTWTDVSNTGKFSIVGPTNEQTLIILTGPNPSASFNGELIAVSAKESGFTGNLAQANHAFTIVKATVKRPYDANTDGKINDVGANCFQFGTSADVYNDSPNMAKFSPALPVPPGMIATPHVVGIPCAIEVLPDCAELRALLDGKICISVPAIGTSHTSGDPTLIVWDNPFPSDPKKGKGVYNATSHRWEATATFRGLPAVPSKSYGRVPAGLHGLLYGEKDAEFTIQMSEFPVKTAKYAVYLGESLRINSAALIDIPANAAQTDQLLAEGGSYGREIFDKMNTAQGEVFNFADLPASGGLPAAAGLQRATEHFTMRRLIVSFMNATNGGGFDVGYYVQGQTLATCNQTYYDVSASPPGWVINPQWAPYDPEWTPNDPEQPAYYDYVGSPYDAIHSVAPFRGECLGGAEICVLKACSDALGKNRFDQVHYDPSYAPWNPTMSVIGILCLSNEYTKHEYSATDTMVFLPGDRCYLANKDDYLEHHPDGYWQGENFFFNGGAPGTFSGLGVYDNTEDQAREKLRTEYNSGHDTSWPYYLTETAAETVIRFDDPIRHKTGH